MIQTKRPKELIATNCPIFLKNGSEKIVMSTHSGVSMNPSKDTEPRAIIIKTTLPQLED